MTVEKITVSLPAELVCALDRLSVADGVSRSFVVKEAVARYATAREMAAESQKRREAADELLVLLDGLGRADVPDDRPVLEILRELRGPLDDVAAR